MKIWCIPAILAAATLAGLLIALFCEQSWGRAAAWLLLALPLAAIGAFYSGLWRRRS
jgi:hypothetical protein